MLAEHVEERQDRKGGDEAEESSSEPRILRPARQVAVTLERDPVGSRVHSRRFDVPVGWSSLRRWSHAGSAAPDPFLDCVAVSTEEIDEYLRNLEEPKRSTLEAVRRSILEAVPDAEQVISYRVPAFRSRGKIVAGFAAFKGHLSYLPFSGSVLAKLDDELKGYTMTKSALHFATDRPLPKSLVKKLVAVRLQEVARRSR